MEPGKDGHPGKEKDRKRAKEAIPLACRKAKLEAEEKGQEISHRDQDEMDPHDHQPPMRKQALKPPKIPVLLPGHLLTRPHQFEQESWSLTTSRIASLLMGSAIQRTKSS
jgi:hypothetical protein